MCESSPILLSGFEFDSRQEIFAMHILIFLLLMIISACVSNTPGQLQGHNVKSDRTVACKHLDADPNYFLPEGYQCRIDSTLVCSAGQGKSNC